MHSSCLYDNWENKKFGRFNLREPLFKHGSEKKNLYLIWMTEFDLGKGRIPECLAILNLWVGEEFLDSKSLQGLSYLPMH